MSSGVLWAEGCVCEERQVSSVEAETQKLQQERFACMCGLCKLIYSQINQSLRTYSPQSIVVNVTIYVCIVLHCHFKFTAELCYFYIWSYQTIKEYMMMVANDDDNINIGKTLSFAERG